MVEHFFRIVSVGRATSDPVKLTRRGSGGAYGIAFGFVVNDRYRTQSGEWRDVPMFIDVEAPAGLVEHVAETVRKGYLLMLEGRLRLDEWTDAAQVRHRKHVFVLHDVKLMQKPKGAYQHTPAPAAQSSEPDSEPEII